MAQVIVERVLAWLIFSVSIGLLPLGFAAQRLRLQGEANWLRVVIGRGELLPMTAIVCGSALGQLVLSGSRSYMSIRLVVVGFAIGIVILASMQFGDLTAAYRRPALVNTRWNRNTSVLLFFFGVIIGIVCIALSEIDR